MNRQRPPGLFITGTDTDVGKTHVAASIVRRLRATGLRVGVYKPAASGCRVIDGELVSDDALRLWEAAGRPGSLKDVCPQRFSAPLAPHLAAQAEGRSLDQQLLRTGLDRWREESDVLIVEGAGGLLSPLGPDEYVIDLALDFDLPLLVVADNSIGVIHRALATLLAADKFRRPMAVAGVILNQAREPDASSASNLAELRSRTIAPVIGVLERGGEAPHLDWLSLARGEKSPEAVLPLPSVEGRGEG
ncbi:MAG TPA: dethiobiotin synthase [Pirellulales bacterium]